MARGAGGALPARAARARASARRRRPTAGAGVIAVVSAGTADIPVAEEAALTAELAGNRVERLFDVGVAGLHRLLAQPHGRSSRRR